MLSECSLKLFHFNQAVRFNFRQLKSVQEREHLTFCQERAKGEGFSHAPINIFSGLNHFASVLIDLLQAAMRLKLLWQLCDCQTHLSVTKDL